MPRRTIGVRDFLRGEQLVAGGMSIAQASKAVGIHKQTLAAHLKGQRTRGAHQISLLDPARLSWKELMTKKATSPQAYATWFQQQDTDPGHVLVDPLWIKGGVGADGVEYPGCCDNNRAMFDPPRGLTGTVVSIASADPSPTKFCSIQWWLYHPDTQQRFLVALLRQAMDAPDFLDRNPLTGEYHGVMHDWQLLSRELGYPITHWVIEATVRSGSSCSTRTCNCGARSTA